MPPMSATSATSTTSATSATPSTRWMSFAPQFLALLRIVAGLMFLLAGTSKLFAFPVGMPGGATAEFPSQVWLGGVLEVVGGGLLVLGLFTRPTAFVLSGEMAVAYFQFHAVNGFWPTVNGGMPAVLYCFLFLYLSAAGAGAWSFDGRRRPRRRPS